MQVLVSSATPNPEPKRIKLQQTEEDQSVWVMFPGTRMYVFTEDKLMIKEQHKLND